MGENVILKKSKVFAIRIIRLYQYKDCNELNKLLITIVKSTNNNLQFVLCNL